MNKKPIIAVWFSCGAASAVALKLTKEMYGDRYEVLAFNTPILEEDQDNIRFKNDVSKWLDVEIKDVVNPKFPNSSVVEIWDKQKYMSGIKGAPCTLMLKKQARYYVESIINIDFHVLGFTIEEKHRHERFILMETNSVIPVLIEEKLTKEDCFDILIEAGIKLPRVYENLNNANCIGCVKSASVWYWNTIRKNYPEVFKQRAEQSRKIGCKLVKYKNKWIFLDELDPEAVGRNPKKNIECSIFCDTTKGIKDYKK